VSGFGSPSEEGDRSILKLCTRPLVVLTAINTVFVIHLRAEASDLSEYDGAPGLTAMADRHTSTVTGRREK
jgi:hypothetical protein